MMYQGQKFLDYCRANSISDDLILNNGSRRVPMSAGFEYSDWTEAVRIIHRERTAEQPVSRGNEYSRRAWERSYRGKEAMAAGFTYEDYQEHGDILTGKTIPAAKHTPKPTPVTEPTPTASLSMTKSKPTYTQADQILAMVKSGISAEDAERIASTPTPKLKSNLTADEKALYDFALSEGRSAEYAAEKVNELRQMEGRELLSMEAAASVKAASNAPPALTADEQMLYDFCLSEGHSAEYAAGQIEYLRGEVA